MRVEAQIREAHRHDFACRVEEGHALDGEIDVRRAFVGDDEGASDAEAARYPPALNLRCGELSLVWGFRRIRKEAHERIANEDRPRGHLCRQRVARTDQRRTDRSAVSVRSGRRSRDMLRRVGRRQCSTHCVKSRRRGRQHVLGAGQRVEHMRNSQTRDDASVPSVVADHFRLLVDAIWRTHPQHRPDKKGRQSRHRF